MTNLVFSSSFVSKDLGSSGRTGLSNDKRFQKLLDGSHVGFLGLSFFLVLLVVLDLDLLNSSSKYSFNFCRNLQVASKCYKFIMHYATCGQMKIRIELFVIQFYEISLLSNKVKKGKEGELEAIHQLSKTCMFIWDYV
jgi:hypothetical protein